MDRFVVEVARERELPSGLDALVRESSAEGFRMVERLRDDWLHGVNRFDEEGEAFFIAHSSGALAGVCGLNRDPYAADPSYGRLRRLYVRPAMRRRGVARALTRSALSAARQRFSMVRVRTFDRGADSFYRALGFSAVESDPNASHEVWLGVGQRAR